MECCTNYDCIFDKKKARKNLKKYHKKGLHKSTQQVVNFFDNKISGMTVMEIGSGVGYLGMELVKKGAESALEIDISSAYQESAQQLRRELDLEDSVEFKTMDFIQHYKTITDHDIVVSDKVICCLPKYKEFIEAGTRRATRYYAIIYPRELKLRKLFVGILNWISQFSKKYKGYKMFFHPHIKKIIIDEGFKTIFDRKVSFWQVSIFEKK